MHRTGRQWHYALPDAERFVCGTYYKRSRWDEQTMIPERGHSICIRCERLMMHGLSGALAYKGQSQRKVRGRFVGRQP
jgi:hypothetical protein